jgi:hypothetical protein
MTDHAFVLTTDDASVLVSDTTTIYVLNTAGELRALPLP